MSYVNKYFQSIPQKHIDVAKKIYMLAGKTYWVHGKNNLLLPEEDLLVQNDYDSYIKYWYAWKVQFGQTRKYKYSIARVTSNHMGQVKKIEFTDEFIKWLGKST